MQFGVRCVLIPPAKRHDRKWVAFAFGAGLIAWGVINIRRGTIWDSDIAGDWLRRDDDPALFWTAIALIFTLAALAIGVGIIAGFSARPL